MELRANDLAACVRLVATDRPETVERVRAEVEPDERVQARLPEVGGEHVLDGERVAGDHGEDARHDHRPLRPDHGLHRRAIARRASGA